MKKIVALLLFTLLIIPFAGCNKKNPASAAVSDIASNISSMESGIQSTVSSDIVSENSSDIVSENNSNIVSNDTSSDIASK